MLFRWVEEDPKEILHSVYECMERTCEKLTQLNIDISNIKGMHRLNRHYAATCTLKATLQHSHLNIMTEMYTINNVALNCPAIGVTNQRETTLVWDKETGEPLYNAIGKAFQLCAVSLCARFINCTLLP